MADYNYASGGFPESPLTDDTLTIGTSVYNYTSKGSWVIDAPTTTSRVVGPIGPQGVQGPRGIIGPSAGDSAYTVAVSLGFIGTETDWINSLEGTIGAIGPQGDQGDQGITGIQGEPGEDVDHDTLTVNAGFF
jgi:hypothetical protein